MQRWTRSWFVRVALFMLRVLIRFAELWIVLRGSNLSCFVWRGPYSPRGALISSSGAWNLTPENHTWGPPGPDTWSRLEWDGGGGVQICWPRWFVCRRYGTNVPLHLITIGRANMCLHTYIKKLTIPISHTYTSIPNSIPARPPLAEIVHPWTSQKMTETVVAHRLLLGIGMGIRGGGATARQLGKDEKSRTRGDRSSHPPGVATHDGCLDRVLRMLLTTHSIVLRAKHVARIWPGGGA